ncbi:zinc ribbon domain-containing protein [Candidatus Bathyarchaeota archaeon]|nr:MAG: zinc ribbon domain-containing protein [Candidatus Bathyarchaeota archaeon]TMI44756.1 MAG: zinc ribbon domain-containing protein [Candidatus Bathyarchaeota archaeon]
MQSSDKRICLKCGRENEASATFCQSCGAPLVPQPAGMQRQATGPMGSGTTMERPLGVTIIGILQILGAIVYILVGTVFVAYAPIIGIILLPIGVIALIIGVAVFTGKNWARILMIILGVLDIISIVGILIGIIIVVYFRRQNVVAWYNQKK